MKFKTGVKKDGAITGMHLQTLIDGGAYGSYGVASTFLRRCFADHHLSHSTLSLPRLPHFHEQATLRPKRGHGTPQPRFGQEVQLDKIAEKTKDRPCLNCASASSNQSNARHGKFLSPWHRQSLECIRRIVKVSGWNEKFRKLPQGRGVGLACSAYLTGAGLPIYWNKMPHSGVQLEIRPQRLGSAVFCGATEIGQGSDDVLAAIVAEVLGIDPFDIRLFTGDTDLGPVDLAPIRAVSR